MLVFLQHFKKVYFECKNRWYNCYMSEDQFMKIFKYMEKRFDSVDDQFKSVKQDLNDLRNIIDGYAGKIDNYSQEMAAMDHRLRRLEKYIQVIADKANIDLDVIHV